MRGHRVSLLAVRTAWKKVFVSSTVSRPNNSARRTPRSRVTLYPIALQGARNDAASVPVTTRSQALHRTSTRALGNQTAYELPMILVITSYSPGGLFLGTQLSCAKRSKHTAGGRSH